MKKQFLVALHAYSKEQLLVEARKMLTPRGAHGLLVVNNDLHISSEGNYSECLFSLTAFLKQQHPQYLVGINPLDLKTSKAIRHTYDCFIDYHEEFGNPFDILWTDDGGIIEDDHRVTLDTNIQHDLKMIRTFSKNNFSYYGGVAFKYQSQPRNLEAVCKEAARHFSVVVTSGDGTGIAASIEKIKLIKSYIGDKPLGLASGVTSENLHEYWLYVDVFIVGTSLLEDPKNQFVYSKEKVEDFRKVFDNLQ